MDAFRTLVRPLPNLGQRRSRLLTPCRPPSTLARQEATGRRTPVVHLTPAPSGTVDGRSRPTQRRRSPPWSATPSRPRLDCLASAGGRSVWVASVPRRAASRLSSPIADPASPRTSGQRCSSPSSPTSPDTTGWASPAPRRCCARTGGLSIPRFQHPPAGGLIVTHRPAAARLTAWPKGERSGTGGLLGAAEVGSASETPSRRAVQAATGLPLIRCSIFRLCPGVLPPTRRLGGPPFAPESARGRRRALVARQARVHVGGGRGGVGAGDRRRRVGVDGRSSPAGRWRCRIAIR